MTREEHLSFCSVCQLKDFNPKQGVICSLTSKIADFDQSCPDYVKDEKAVELESQNKREKEEDISKSINWGRYALLFIGTLYLINAIYETFISDDYLAAVSLFNWTLSVSFFTLSVWSYQKPRLSFQVGLGIYLGLILLLGIFDPVSLLSGYFIKFFVICVLVAAIMTAKSVEKNSEDS